MSNPLLSLLDIDYPLIQAPMAGVSTPALAAAVSNAGALGSLGLGASTVAQAEAMIVATRQLTDRPFNVNLFCHAPPRRDARREADWATTLRPHFARYGSTPPDSLSEIYQTFVGHAPMLELFRHRRQPVGAGNKQQHAGGQPDQHGKQGRQAHHIERIQRAVE